MGHRMLYVYKPRILSGMHIQVVNLIDLGKIIELLVGFPSARMWPDGAA